MRVQQLTRFGLANLHTVEVPTPEPGAHEVRVRVEAASLNYRDHLVVNGGYKPGQFNFPFVPIADGAGVVTCVGPAVTRFREGDRVMTFYKTAWIAGSMRPEWDGSDLGGPLDGVMREEAVFPEYWLTHTPAHLTSLQSATLPIAALTAWQALEEAHVTSGQTVLAIGTGGVALFALQLAKLRGARVAIVSSSDAKLRRAKALGADFTFNYRTDPDWGSSVFAATGGVDAIVETGGAATLAQSLAAVRPHGIISLIGFISGADAALPLVTAIVKRVRLQGVSVAPLEQQERMLRALEASRLEPVIDRVFGFDELRTAFDCLTQGNHFGKIAIDFSR